MTFSPSTSRIGGRCCPIFENGVTHLFEVAAAGGAFLRLDHRLVDEIPEILEHISAEVRPGEPHELQLASDDLLLDVGDERRAHGA